MKTPSLLCSAAFAALLAACSTPVGPGDGGSDASATDGSMTNRDAPPSDVAADSAQNGDSAAPTDASPDDAASPVDAASESSTAPDASMLDGASPDASDVDAAADAAFDAPADSALEAAADSAPDALADSAPDVPADSAPDVSCLGALRLCAGRCVDTQSDVANCGACGMVCPAPASGTVACNAGVCGAVPGSQVTLSTGMATPITLGQPTLALTMVVETAGIYPSRDAFGSGSALGMVHLFAGNFGPNGAPFAYGQVLSIASNSALFSLLGTTYGGDGRTTFGLPDLRERLLVGQGSPDATLGVLFGNATATLTLGTMPAHSHLLPDGVTRTSVTGRGGAFDARAPSLPLTAWVALEGIFPSTSGGGDSPFLGEIRWFGGNFTPTTGWAPADGRLLAISAYSALFAILGTTYGGDGRTNFAVPDLRGRAPVGAGAVPGGPTIALGELVGSTPTTLNAMQLPAHQHALAGGGTTQATGNSQPLSAYQPSLGVTWLIATQGIFPARDGSGSFLDTPYLGEVIAFGGNFAPRGYLKAEGQLLSIASNSALFALLGTSFGGDGRTTFALPDLRGRAPIGTSAAVTVGTQSGAATRTLVPANLPPHTHTY